MTVVGDVTEAFDMQMSPGPVDWRVEFSVQSDGSVSLLLNGNDISAILDKLTMYWHRGEMPVFALGIGGVTEMACIADVTEAWFLNEALPPTDVTAVAMP